jgi:polyphosphate kinase 2 (PPK2 family)
VEGFATDKEWKRAYEEINEFERLLGDDGTIVTKIYLHITKDEQLARFKRREADPYKHWKITDEDWRNRRKWDQHNEAAEDMFERTSTGHAPWRIVPANYKWNARMEVLRCVNEALEEAGIKKL